MKAQDFLDKQADTLYKIIMQSDHQWRKEWATHGLDQQNKKGVPYQGMNQFDLFFRMYQENKQDPRWFTFNQIKELNYKLKKGSKSSQIGFYTTTARHLSRDEQNNPILDENGKKLYEQAKLDRPVLVVYNVFNGADIEGLEPFKFTKLTPEQQTKLAQENYQNADKMIKAFCEKNNIKIKEIPTKKAFYRQVDLNWRMNEKDEMERFESREISMPLKGQFNDLGSYYSTLFHEVGHATKVLGIRINQEKDNDWGNNFGSKNYAKEELTAELTALFLCKQFNIDGNNKGDNQENSFAYLKSWIETGVLDKDDLKIAIKEATRATKAIYAEHLNLQKNLSQTETLNNIEGQKIKTKLEKQQKSLSI